ncbi:hypothetical protein [Actinoplanes auranticolor]|uniref:Uncharacterized protein n=1 Tax=Actinoplanes auranticolor TaxID=47988 RepID=A0A919S6P2_9ACTN|nr:hypothetical protein [Actinoplanes auranticolor]GIM66592.1 hypothetical protein Aau02nite_23550 [Actinoplanes auranticolor]
MSGDREQIEPRTEDELAQQRQARFGHLPARVSPEDLVESEEAEPVHEEPDQPMVRREWG